LVGLIPVSISLTLTQGQVELQCIIGISFLSSAQENQAFPSK